MAAHAPPIPPDQRPQHGADRAQADVSGKAGQTAADRDRNTEEQGNTGNTKQNTTNKGLQQDR